MTREFKHIPLFAVKSASDGERTRTGIASVFGNIDDGLDRIHPGAYTKTIQEGSVRHKHLWAHDWSQPPTASIKEIKEITRAELPPEVLQYAPDATGGLLVTREYFKSELGDLILQCIDSGDMEMSIGYMPTQTEWSTIKDGDSEMQVREIKEVKLLETSDVPFGMNPATVAAFAKAGIPMRPLGSILQDLAIWESHNIKAGARNSTQDMAIIGQIHQKLLDLGFGQCKMLDNTDEKSVPNDNPTGPEAESATHSNSLPTNELKLNDLRLSQFLGVKNYVSTSREAEGISG